MIDSKEVAVIGLGPSGVSASIYLSRYGMVPFCFEKELIGGKINQTEKIENYAGIPSIKGPQLSMALEEQLSSLSIRPIYKEVTKVSALEDGTYHVEYGKNLSHDFKYVILANGLIPSPFSIPGEEKFKRRGISRCAICDGPLYKGKNVAVIGAGNAAFEEATYLASICNHVSLIARRETFRAQEKVIEKFKSLNNTEIYAPYQVVEANGTSSLESLLIQEKKTGEIKSLLIEGLFLYVGEMPSLSFLNIDGLTDEKGYLITDEKKMTKRANLYAVGDCRNTSLRQVATAVSDGAIAASDIFRKYQEEN